MKKKAGPKGGFKKGHDPRRNVTKPGTGRPPDEFKALCQELATREDTLAAVKGILADPSHGQFMQALKWATENGYGKAPQPIAGDPNAPLSLRVTFDALK